MIILLTSNFVVVNQIQLQGDSGECINLADIISTMSSFDQRHNAYPFEDPKLVCLFVCCLTAHQHYLGH